MASLAAGKAKPSAEMVETLAAALDVSQQQRNAMLRAAGLAPRYPSTALGHDWARHVRSAVEFRRPSVAVASCDSSARSPVGERLRFTVSPRRAAVLATPGPVWGDETVPRRARRPTVQGPWGCDIEQAAR